MAGQPEIITRVGFQADQASLARLGTSVETSINRAVGNLGKSGLGNISRDFNQFDRSLDSATARVLSFGLSAGAIIGVQKAFSSLVRETIAVDRSMRDINVIFNLSTKNLTSFGSELFKISRDTGQNFSIVADAAKELSRQGLSVSETLQRTKDSLVLVRQSGLDAGESVKAITVALNSFNKEALTSSDVINKLASVDARYAVSSADLADALSRVGSTASDAGVSFNELLGVVTAVQQITGRSGSVIGNSLKSIFTRVSRADVIDQLRELGVAVSTSQNGIQKLEALASALKTATPETANVIKELAGGVYQINAVAAALNDLGSNYSITARATRDAANASNEAYIRNEQLNKSYEALINRTGANLRQIGSGIGNLTVGPALEKILGTLNTVLEAAVSKDGNNVGEIMAKGLIKGFGEFISGPGLAVVVYGIGKLLARFTSEAATGFKTILGLNEAAKQRVNIEVAVSSLLRSQPELIAQANTGLQGQLAIIQKINQALLQQQGELAARAAATSLVVNTGISRNLFRTKAVGHIPEVQEKMGAYAAGYKPGKVKEMNVPDLGRIIYNDAEKVRYFPGMKQPAIIPPQTSRAGKSYKKEFEKSHGFDPYRNEGLVPSFAKKFQPSVQLGKLIGRGSYKDIYNIQSFQPDLFGGLNIDPKEAVAGILRRRNIKDFEKQEQLFKYGAPVPQIYGYEDVLAPTRYRNDFKKKNAAIIERIDPFSENDAKYIGTNSKKHEGDVIRNISGVLAQYLKAKGYVDSYRKAFGWGGIQGDLTLRNLGVKRGFSRGQALDELAVLAELNPLQKIGAGDVKYIDAIIENSGLSIADVGYLNPRKANSGLIPNYANPKDRFLSFLSQINPSYVKSFRGIQKQDQGLAGFIRNSTDLRGADAQRDMASILGKKNLQYTPSKYGLETTSYFNLDKSPKELREQIGGLFSKFGKEIPNFSALTNAISREASAGIPKSQIRIGNSPAIVSAQNPLGLGVYNTIDEPGGLNQGINRALREGQNPKTYGVPNFAPNSSLQYTSLLPESQRKFTELAFNDLIKRVKDGTINFSKLSSIIDKFAATHQVAVEPLYKYIDSLRKGTALEKKLQDKTSAAIRENVRNTLPFQTQLIPQRKPLLIGYSPSPPNPVTQGTQLGFPGFGSQELIDKQAQLNLYRDQALQRQAMIQNVRKKYQEKLYNDRIIAQQKQGNTINAENKEGFFSSGRGQNLAIGASLILPIAAGAISESIGTSTIGRRGAGQTVQSLANIGSYGALGASFGPQGAIAGLGLGTLLETPRIIKSFTDRIPDLDREIEKLTENINATNDGFSSIIQTSEKLNAFARGDLTLTPQQFLNQKQSIGTNLASLAGKNPNFSTDIGRVFSGGNISEQSELLGRIQSININKKNRQELERLGETISPSLQPSVFKTLKNTFSQLTSLATSFSLTPINTSRLFNQKTGNFNPLLGFGVGSAGLSKEEQTNLKELTRSTVFQTNDSGKSIASYLIDRFRNNPEDKDIQAITGAIQKLGNDSSFENRDLLLSRLEKAAGGVGDIDIEPFKRILLSIGEKGIETIVSELQSSIGPRTIKGLGSFKAPDVIKNLRDSGNLLRPIQDLFQNINQIGASFQARGQQNINTINNRLVQESFSIQSDAGIRAGRVATSSPLQALDIQFLANQRETKLQERGELEKLNLSLEGSEQGSILKFLNQLQQQTLSEKDNSKREKRVKDFDILLKRLLPKSNLNGSGSLGDAIGTLGGETRQEFFQNVRKELESNREQLSTFKGELGGLGYNELQDYQESLLELLQSEFDITLDYNTKKKDILEKISNAQKQNIEQDKQKREQIVQGILQQYSSIIKDVDQFSNDIRNILENNKNLTGFKAIRANELGLSRLALAEERKNYSSGDIAARDLRPLVSDVAKKQLRNDGSVSRESLNDIFKSSFGYNKQDFGQDLISDMEGIRDALVSIRPAAKDAFASMVDGSKSASDAFRQFGVSIATNVLNNVAKLAFDNLFSNLFNNNTLGAVGSLFSAKSNGGIVGYASGGMVTGGSGVRDDVPAMLANGAYVIKKSSVNKYGSGFLSSLNSGKGFANGGINQILKNDFVTTGRKMGIKGNFDVDPRLSVIGQTDENNPSNALKFGKEQDYYGYLGTIENYKKAVKQFEAAKTQRLIGAYVSGAINIGAYGLSSYRNGQTSNSIGGQSRKSFYSAAGQEPATFGGDYAMGGIIRRFAGGGRADSIPALLTSGEFVMSPQAVNRMGVGYMNRLNAGQISPKGYNTGGFVGRDINAASPVRQDNSEWGQINSSLLELIKLNQEIRDIQNGTKTKVNDKNVPAGNVESSTTITPSVNITINVMGDKTNAQTQSNNTDNSNNSGQNIKQFAELMKNVSLDTIVTQMRPGGLLANSVRK